MIDRTVHVFDRVVSALREESVGLIGERQGIKPSHRFVEDLGFDSLDCVLTVMTIEDEFGIEITDYEAEKCEDVQSLVNLVEQKLLALGESVSPIRNSPPQDGHYAQQDLAQQLWNDADIMALNSQLGLTMDQLVKLIGLVDKMRARG